MNDTDPYMMLLVQMAIILFTIFAIFRDYQIRKREQGAEATAEVARGEKSMAALYTLYGATIASCLV